MALTYKGMSNIEREMLSGCNNFTLAEMAAQQYVMKIN